MFNVPIYKSATVIMNTAILFLTGCSSGVMQIGPGTYRITSEWQTMTGAESGAVEDATKHCVGQGRQLDVVSMRSSPASLGQYATATVNFHCIAAKP